MSERTLGEQRWADIDNTEHIIGHSKTVQFNDMTEYLQYLEGFLAREIEHVTNNQLAYQWLNKRTPEDVYWLDEEFHRRGIRIEGRNRKGDDTWRSGHYVYKDNEIKAFIGIPTEVPTVIYRHGMNPVKAMVMSKAPIC